MTAVVVPFPMVRRQAFAERHARYGATLKPAAFEKYLSRQTAHQADLMARNGIAAHLVRQEIVAMESAIRAALWFQVLQPSGGPG
jgi:hypothetical protein